MILYVDILYQPPINEKFKHCTFLKHNLLPNQSAYVEVNYKR